MTDVAAVFNAVDKAAGSGQFLTYLFVNDPGLLHEFVEMGRLELKNVLEVHSHLVKVV